MLIRLETLKFFLYQLDVTYKLKIRQIIHFGLHLYVHLYGHLYL